MHNVLCPVAGLERMTSGSVAKDLTISRHTGCLLADVRNVHLPCDDGITIFRMISKRLIRSSTFRDPMRNFRGGGVLLDGSLSNLE